MLISYGDLSDAKLLQTYGELPFQNRSAAATSGGTLSVLCVSQLRCLLCVAEMYLLEHQMCLLENRYLRSCSDRRTSMQKLATWGQAGSAVKLLCPICVWMH